MKNPFKPYQEELTFAQAVDQAEAPAKEQEESCRGREAAPAGGRPSSTRSYLRPARQQRTPPSEPLERFSFSKSSLDGRESIPQQSPNYPPCLTESDISFARRLGRFFEALKTEPNPDLVDFVFLAIATGARKADIFSMRWQDISLDDNSWYVPHPKREPYTAPLVPEAIQILASRQQNRIKDSPWVFPSHGKTGHLTDLKNRWKKLKERAGIKDLWMHDLRRTLGSWQAARGASELIIGKSLGHKAGSPATKIYSQIDLDPVRESVTNATRAIFAASKERPKELEEQNG